MAMDVGSVGRVNHILLGRGFRRLAVTVSVRTSLVGDLNVHQRSLSFEVCLNPDELLVPNLTKLSVS